MLVIGLTGGVGTGKSTVARRLLELGAEVLDADRYAREAVAKGEPALEAIRRRFGDRVLLADGSLDRKALGAIVFRDEGARRDLEAIVHPEVRARMRRDLERLKRSGASVAVCDIPLLYETGYALDWVDGVLVVYAPEWLQKERVIARDGLSPDEAERRIRAQIPTEEKARRADWVIHNDGPLEATLAQVDAVWEEWMARCGSP